MSFGAPNTGTLANSTLTPQPTKSAHRMLQRQPDGSLKSVLIDDNTGQPVSNPTGYNVTDGFFSDLSSLGLNPVQGTTTSTSGPGVPQTPAQKIITNADQGSNGQHDNSHAGSRAQARSESNNFGYIDKPSALAYASFAPGMIGLAGKAANAAINANNLGAVNTARAELGLAPEKGWDAAKGIISDNKGQVANVNIGNQNYSVGLAAMSPSGMTNMTPSEARMHSLLNQAPINELSPSQAQAQQAAFAAANQPGTFTGPLSSLLNPAKSFIDNLFAPAQNFINTTFNPNLNTFPAAPPADLNTVADTTNTNRNSAQGNPNGGGSGWSDTSSHPAAAGSGSWGSGGFATSNTGSYGSSASPNGRGPGTGGGGGGGSLSPGAQGAIDHGQGGLY